MEGAERERVLCETDRPSPRDLKHTLDPGEFRLPWPAGTRGGRSGNAAPWNLTGRLRRSVARDELVIADVQNPRT
jgi:hypothetical protein